MKRITLKITEKPYTAFPFYKDGEALCDGPLWGMTLKSAGSMRFRWNEKNPVRDEMLERISMEISGSSCGWKCGILKAPETVPVQLDHTKIVYDIKNKDDTSEKTGDGIITLNRKLMPVVTVADCMPLYLYDSVTGVFGVVHSGWKGTGIIGEAIKLAEKNYGAKPENISVSIGAHIHDCCYVVNEERAEYFRKNFTESCVQPVPEGEKLCNGAPSKWNFGTGKPWRLSLLKANLSVLEKCGIRDENIALLDECTCCNKLFGSNRRETSENGDDVPKEKAFTVQAAFTLWR